MKLSSGIGNATKALKSLLTTITSINIQGVNTSFSELQVLFSQINDQNLNLGILALQECHLSDIDMNPFDLIGYERISSDPVVSSFGNDINYKIKKKYVGSKLWEGQFFLDNFRGK